MAFNLRTTTQIESSKTEEQLRALLNGYTGNIKSAHSQIMSSAIRCVVTRKALDYVAANHSDEVGSDDGQLQELVAAIKQEKPKYSPHDICVGLEGAMSEYSSKVNTFAQTLITTVRNYSCTVFDLFVKKLRLNKDIDTSKFVELDSSMQMVVMTYGDYAELAHPMAEGIGVIAKDVQSILPLLTSIRKQLANKEETKDTLERINTIIHEGELAKYLLNHKLAEFEYGMDTNGAEGLINISPSKRLLKIESSERLNDAGWNDVDKVKNSIILKNAENISKQINNLYKLTIDVMDETRRINTEHCVADPYTCTALIKFGSMLSQEVSLYTKVFDLCWTTALRVSQACSVE